MSLCLAVETSSGSYAVALGGESVLFQASDREFPGLTRDLAGLVGLGLESIGAGHKDLAAIGVNIGPGGLSSTRAGVSFANGLAFSLQVPLHAFSYFDIAARQIARSSPSATLCAVPAAAGTAYIVLAANGARIARFGPFEPTLLAAVAEMDGLGEDSEIAVAGRMRERVAALLPGRTVVDSGVDGPDPAILLEMTRLRHEEKGGSFVPAVPLNELAEDFRA